MARNDAFELSIEHPIDPAGKWANLVPGNLIKANVPLRTTPIIPYGEGSTLQRLYGSGSYTAFVTSLKRYTVNSGASQTDRSVFSAPTGYLTVTQPIRLKIMGAGASVFIVGTLEWNGCNWALVAWENGRGWMKLSAITLAETLTLSDARSETERGDPVAPDRALNCSGFTKSSSPIPASKPAPGTWRTIWRARLRIWSQYRARNAIQQPTPFLAGSHLEDSARTSFRCIFAGRATR